MVVVGIGSVSFEGKMVSGFYDSDNNCEDLGFIGGVLDCSITTEFAGQLIDMSKENEVTIIYSSDRQIKRNKRQLRRNKKRANGTRIKKSQRRIGNLRNNLKGVITDISKDGECTMMVK